MASRVDAKRIARIPPRFMACLGLLTQLASSQPWTQPYTSPTAIGDCAGLSANLKTEFTVEPVISRAQFSDVAPYRIIKMAFHLQPGARNTDIYIAEKGNLSNRARVLYYNGATNSLKVIGTLPNANYGGGGSTEHGLLGIALDPRSFALDHFLYLYYSFGTGLMGSDKVGIRITRVTLDSMTREIDFGSERLLLHIPAATSGGHMTGSGMSFDHAGNLYVSVGDNETLAIGPGNTADLRGSILRIKPDAMNPKGYTIPDGNFGGYWARQFDGMGRSGLAARYRDTARVRGEIYIKGVRNVYSFSVDPTRPGTVEWSQCGPDAQRGETHSFATQPAFAGWPFWVYEDGKLVRQSSKDNFFNEVPGDPTSSEWAAFNFPEMNASAPVNNWPGVQGIDSLPPYHLPFFGYKSPNCAMGGPIVRYRPNSVNPGNMPPHLDKTVMVSDFASSADTNSIWAIPEESVIGTGIGKPTRVFSMALGAGRPGKRYPVDFQQGPDGVLYMIDWGAPCCTDSPPMANNGISRISYTGTCQDPGWVPVRSTPDKFLPARAPWFRIRSGHVLLTDAGDGLLRKGRHTLSIMTLHGKVLRTFTGTGLKEYPLPRLATGQLYILRAETPLGIAQMTYGPL